MARIPLPVPTSMISSPPEIISSSSGTIGTHENPLDISAPVIDMVNMLEDMGDGNFMFLFEMTNLKQESATSKVVYFEVKDGSITTKVQD